MKKLLMLVLAIGFASFGAQAQTVGVKGGLSVANLSTNDGEVNDKNSRLGFTGGLFLNAPIGEVFALQPEILYTQKGAKYEVIGIDVDTRSSYLEVPVLFQVTILDPFYFYAGPQFSYLLDVKTTYNGDGNIVIEDDEDPDNYNRTDLGGAIGVGLNFERVVLDARAAVGAIDFDKDRTIEGVEMEAKNLKNFTFLVTAGIKF